MVLRCVEPPNRAGCIQTNSRPISISRSASRPAIICLLTLHIFLRPPPTECSNDSPAQHHCNSLRGSGGGRHHYEQDRDPKHTLHPPVHRCFPFFVVLARLSLPQLALIESFSRRFATGPTRRGVRRECVPGMGDVLRGPLDLIPLPDDESKYRHDSRVTSSANERCFNKSPINFENKRGY